jgi:hypothetical protein
MRSLCPIDGRAQVVGRNQDGRRVGGVGLRCAKRRDPWTVRDLLCRGDLHDATVGDPGDVLSPTWNPALIGGNTEHVRGSPMTLVVP